MKRHYLLYFALITGTIACNKTEGPGGTSIITGHVKIQDHTEGRPEITEIIFSQGVNIEHGDYWVINNPAGLTQYYVYYSNPTWVSEANPFLEGRTGVAVSFNYSDSNVEIAANTANAISPSLGGSFDIIRNVDVLTFVGKTNGDAPDADKVTTNFQVNTAQQGKNSISGLLQPAVDEKVYLVYGDQEVYGDLTRTGGDGEYQFKNLTNCNYTVYSVRTDALTGEVTKVIQKVEITDKKTVVEAPEIKIIN
jgi:hypothetical protein